MNKKTIKKLSLIFIITIFINCSKSYGAIASKPATKKDASEVMINSSVSNSYLLCQRMTKAGESLEGATVVPHLATNGDWGAVSYLSNSAYGTNTKGGNTGLEVELDGITYYSTNGNATGIMNWGINYYKETSKGYLYTQTATIIQNYITDMGKTPPTSTSQIYMTEIYKNRGTKFVDTIKDSVTVANTLGMAFAESAAFKDISPYKDHKCYYSPGTNVNYPTAARSGLFGYNVGGYNGYVGTGYVASGAGSEYGTFRPVIWNK